MKVLFFSQKSNSEISVVGSTFDLNGIRYSLFLWKPDLRSLVPAGLPLVPYAFWWFMHFFHLFANQDYSILVVYTGNSLVHRSCVFPRYFRFPFMSQDDLQIGDIWTHPEHRGRGIAFIAIKKIVDLQRKPGRKFWYVVEENNISSIRVIEKVGFQLEGEGGRTKWLGLKVFGTYAIQDSSVKSPNSPSR